MWLYFGIILSSLYLIPSVLSETAFETIPTYIIEAVKNCQVIFAENERTARRFLKSIYKEIVKPERIVFEHITGPHFTATVTFAEQGKKTLLTWRMLFDAAEQLQQVIKTFKADEGLKQNIEKLEVYLQQAKV